ncbi:hypothetical protein LCGC14_1714720 [marine sediment metagenome]|uniref:Uncharacterized protein n=1 Tax=marine sediment metagenome TaxID=412755 RepID=A0A0F9HEM9_9ZZZZ
MPQEGTWAWDSTNEKWVKIKTDSQGRLYTVAVIDELDDIGDVNVPTPTDDDILYWDAAANKWQDIAHLGVTDAHHAKYTNSEAQTTVKANVKLNELQAPDGAVACGGQILDNIGAPSDAGDALRKGTALTITEMPANMKLLTITFIIDGGGSAITTGEKGHLEIPFACTINQVTMLADQSGSIVVDIWKRVYADFPPTNTQSITASAVPTVTTAVKSQDSTLTGWTTAIAAGDILAFNVDSVTDIQRLTISLKVTKT